MTTPTEPTAWIEPASRGGYRVCLDIPHDDGTVSTIVVATERTYADASARAMITGATFRG